MCHAWGGVRDSDLQHDEFTASGAARKSRGTLSERPGATLETLGERVPEGLAENLASQLPQEIGEHLTRTVIYGGAGRGERFDRAEFISRIAQRAHVDEPEAAFLARAVLDVVDDATTGGIMEKVRLSLPDDLRAFIDVGSTGEMA